MTLDEIAAAQQACSMVQFPGNTPLEPLEGLIEEAGELAHARLKRRQGIRHTPEECIAMERDAVGDMGIYLLDFGWRAKVAIRIDDCGGRDGDRAFGMLAYFSGLLAYEYHQVNTSHYSMELACGRIAGWLASYSRIRGWDFLDILNETWSKVSRRDWVASPIDAATGEEA